MTVPPTPSSDERLERLEQSLARLERIITALAPRLAAREGLNPRPGAPAATPVAGTARAPHGAPPPPARRGGPGTLEQLAAKGPDYWFSRVGIGLVVLAVAFLFKYSIDRGWLTPWVRVAIGVAVGAVLYGVGYRVRARRRVFAHLMFGGGTVALYTTGFAAYQVLALVEHPVAMAFMVAVTVATLVLAVREHGVELSVLGAAGGLATPFLLYTEAGSVPGLIAYACIVLAGTSGIYLFTGWRSLLWTTVVGGIAILVAGMAGGTSPGSPAVSDAWALQIGVAFMTLTFWLLPVGREVLSARDPARWPPPTSRAPRQAGALPHHVAVLTIVMPTVAILFSSAAWDDTLGWPALGLAAVTLAVGRGVQDAALRWLASAHVASAAVLVAVGLPMLTSGDRLLVGWAAEALALHAFARRTEDRSLTAWAHLVMALPLVALVPRLVDVVPAATAILNARAVTDLGLFALLLLASRTLAKPDEARLYVLAVYLGVLAWLWRELVSLPEGQAYVTGAWGALGIGLLIVGLRTTVADLRRAGTATLFLVVAKLFLVDLANVDALVRILLFMVFGGIFLGIGYFFPALWRGPGGPAGTPRAEGTDDG